jgi:tetratricopeptide (TPR) repeat protein
MKNLENLKKKIHSLVNQFHYGNYKLVITETNLLLKKLPNNPFLLNLLGSCYQKLGFLETAEKNFLQVFESDKNNLAAMNNLANTYKDMLLFSKAEDYYKKILKINPKYLNSIVNYANLKFQLNDYKNAIDLYKEALNINPNLENTHYNIGLTYQSYGMFDKAEFHFKEMLKINPDATNADRLISRFTKYTENNLHLKDMEERSKNENLRDHSKMNLYFALSKAYEDTKNFKRSYEFMKAANDIVGKKFVYDKKSDDKFIIDLKENFKKLSHLKISENKSEKQIIFILGLPRSGTSLTEQILSSHRSIYGAGELNYLEKLINKNFMIKNKLNPDTFQKDKFGKNINDIRKNYIESIKNFKTEKKIITDKAPQNFKWIGFINYIFPESKIIHCKRDIKDNFLSLYKNFFPEGLEWTYNKDNLINYCKNYLDITNFWKTKYPDKIFDVVYENLVSNPTKVTEELLRFCDLEWDDNCIKFYNTKRSIKTLSVAEARRPIYKSSLSASQNFETYLSDVYKKLDNL